MDVISLLELALGLGASAALYLAAIHGFVWAGRRRIEWAAQHGVTLGPKPRLPAWAEIWRRHRGDTTVIYGALFVALALAGFTIWQQLAFAGLCALVLGSLWISNASANLSLEVASPTRQAVSKAGYGCLAVADWFGYLGVLCFASVLIAQPLR